MRHAAGLKEDGEFPPRVYLAARVRLLADRSTLVAAPAMADLALPIHYREPPFLSRSVPGVTVVLPELDDPAAYPRRFARLPNVIPFTRYASAGR